MTGYRANILICHRQFSSPTVSVSFSHFQSLTVHYHNKQIHTPCSAKTVSSASMQRNQATRWNNTTNTLFPCPQNVVPTSKRASIIVMAVAVVKRPRNRSERPRRMNSFSREEVQLQQSLQAAAWRTMQHQSQSTPSPTYQKFHKSSKTPNLLSNKWRMLSVAFADSCLSRETHRFMPSCKLIFFLTWSNV